MARLTDFHRQHRANHTYGGAKNKLALYRIFSYSQLGKRGFDNLYYKVF
jgi:hypothetical protein